jgi:hypothetical protein
MGWVHFKDQCKLTVWYLPYHLVVSETAMKRKIRVVFDTSQLARKGHCLNDFQLPGPPLQRDLSLILANWRHYKFAFTADIIQMFRQIGVDPVNQDYQRIFKPGNLILLRSSTD